MRLFPTLLALLPVLAGMAAASESRFVLTVSPTSGEVRAVIGGKLLRFGPGDARARDVGELLREGSNFVRLGWTDVRGGAEVTLARVGSGEAEVLLRYRLDGVLKPPSGALNFAVARLPEQAGSGEEGVRLGALMSKGLARIFLNGVPLGDCASFEGRDVTPLLRAGRNELKVAWSKDFGGSLPSGEVALTRGPEVLARWRASDWPSLSGSRVIAFTYEPEAAANVRREGE